MMDIFTLFRRNGNHVNVDLFNPETLMYDTESPFPLPKPKEKNSDGNKEMRESIPSTPYSEIPVYMPD